MSRRTVRTMLTERKPEINLYSKSHALRPRVAAAAHLIETLVENEEKIIMKSDALRSRVAAPVDDVVTDGGEEVIVGGAFVFGPSHGISRSRRSTIWTYGLQFSR